VGCTTVNTGYRVADTVAFEHHFRRSLKGYPKIPFHRNPHLASVIISICDVYDAFSQRRNYHNDFPPDKVYELMMREKAGFFIPELVDKFFKIMGVWPIGTIVSLTDGRMAVVKEENEEDIFSPKVEIIMVGQEREIIDLKQTKGSNQIEKFINPWKEGKSVLNIIQRDLL